MFKRQVFIFSLVLFGLSSFLVWSLTKTSQEDLYSYQKLIECTSPTRSDLQSSSYSSKQQRGRVQRDFYFPHEQQRKYIRLISQSSELLLHHHDEEKELVEEFKKAEGYMQEELYYVLYNGKEVQRKPDGRYFFRNANDGDAAIELTDMERSRLKPMQIIRYFDADNATYHYQTNLLVAKNVRLKRYVAPGHHLVEKWQPKNFLSTMNAELMEFSLENQRMHFKAQQLKATFDPSEKS